MHLLNFLHSFCITVYVENNTNLGTKSKTVLIVNHVVFFAV